jgi:glycosyltransferase involved in cell wall biosynthesis
MTITVDVAIPCYRYGGFLSQCVESVLSQEDVDVRILILDDASPDNTTEVAAELTAGDRRVEYRRHAANKGHIATYNEGIEWASADLFLLLSADDYLLPGALTRVATLMEATPEMSFAFGAAGLLFDDGSYMASEPLGTNLKAETAVLSCLAFVKAMNGRNIVPTPTAVVRTNIQKRVGGYCHELPHAGDMAMWLRLAAEGPVGFLQAQQGVYRIHAQNMSRSYSSTRLPDIQQRRAAIEHFIENSSPKLPNSIPWRKILRQALGRDAAYHARAAFADGDFEISYQLSKLAQELHPGIWHTAPWFRLLVHRAVGQRAWRLLRSAYRGGD